MVSAFGRSAISRDIPLYKKGGHFLIIDRIPSRGIQKAATWLSRATAHPRQGGTIGNEKRSRT
ncbi:hypothetical protein Lal_00003828 [Lupinus albus]|nr:hypothetical protein Lal_00003828 [Lupinus albus]